jgi:hypothetical protein
MSRPVFEKYPTVYSWLNGLHPFDDILIEHTMEHIPISLLTEMETSLLRLLTPGVVYSDPMKSECMGGCAFDVRIVCDKGTRFSEFQEEQVKVKCQAWSDDQNRCLRIPKDGV